MGFRFLHVKLIPFRAACYNQVVCVYFITCSEGTSPRRSHLTAAAFICVAPEKESVRSVIQRAAITFLEMY